MVSDHQLLCGRPLGSTLLVERGVVSDSDIARVLGQQYDVPFVDLDEIEIEESVKALVPMSKLLPTQKRRTGY